MSKGLGSCEKEILDQLRSRSGFPLSEIAAWTLGRHWTHSEYQSRLRAAHGLERKGLCRLIRQTLPDRRGRQQELVLVWRPEDAPAAVSVAAAKVVGDQSSSPRIRVDRFTNLVDPEIEGAVQALLVKNYAFSNPVQWAKTSGTFRYVGEPDYYDETLLAPNDDDDEIYDPTDDQCELGDTPSPVR
jgi:hypothetical protein